MTIVNRDPGDETAATCPFDTRDECWDDQEVRADATYECPVHGRAEDTLDRLGVDVL